MIVFLGANTLIRQLNSCHNMFILLYLLGIYYFLTALMSASLFQQPEVFINTKIPKCFLRWLITFSMESVHTHHVDYIQKKERKKVHTVILVWKKMYVQWHFDRLISNSNIFFTSRSIVFFLVLAYMYWFRGFLFKWILFPKVFLFLMYII